MFSCNLSGKSSLPSLNYEGLCVFGFPIKENDANNLYYCVNIVIKVNIILVTRKMWTDCFHEDSFTDT